MITKHIRRIRRSPRLASLLTMVGGTTVVQILNVLSAPVLTRLYSPEDYGLLAVFLSFGTIAGIVFNLQYGSAIVLPREDDDARGLVQLALRLTLGLGGITVAVALAVTVLAGERRLLEEVPNWVPLAGLLVGIALAVERTVNYWLVREQAFKLIATAAVVAAVVSTVFKIGAGWLWSGAAWLIAGYFVTYVTNLAVQVARSPTLSVRSLLARPAPSAEGSLARVYDDFPRFRLPQQLLNTAGQQVPPLILMSLFDPTMVGLYALADRMVKLPGRFLSDAVRKVYYQKAAQLKTEDGDMFRSLLQTTGYLAVAGLIPFGCIAVLSPWLFGIVFGPEWVEAGTYAAWLCAWMYTAFFNTPAVVMMPVLRLQDRYLVFNIVVLVARVAALYLGASAGGAKGAIAAFVIVGMVYNLIVIADVHIQTWRQQYASGEG